MPMIGNETAAGEAGDFSWVVGTGLLTRFAGDGFFFIRFFNRIIEAALTRRFENPPP
jgi:hypothetical protein